MVTVAGDFLFPAGFLLALLTAGFIQARLHSRHPDINVRVGAPFAAKAGGELATSPTWLRFVLHEHFRLKDPLLTILCLLHVSSAVLLIVSLFSNVDDFSWSSQSPPAA